MGEGLCVINKKNKFRERGAVMMVMLFSSRKHKDNHEEPAGQQIAAAMFLSDGNLQYRVGPAQANKTYCSNTKTKDRFEMESQQSHYLCVCDGG